MEKATHAKITINDAGETEVRQMNVVSDVRPGRRHSLLSVDVSQAVKKIEQAEPLEKRIFELDKLLADLYRDCVKFLDSESPVTELVWQANLAINEAWYSFDESRQPAQRPA